MDRAIPILAALLALCGCATPTGGDLVWIEVGGDGDCRIAVGQADFALPADRDRLGAHLGRAARRSAGALISDRPARARFGCWDEAMALTSAAGFARIGLVSDDRPEAPVG